MKKISILISDLSGNCVVRSYPIAKVLEHHYEIEVIGPVFGDGIFEPYKDEFDYRSVLLDAQAQLPRFLKVKRGLLGMKWIVDNITGDMIYAFKPRVTTLGIGLLAKCKRKLPLILDIEDWEAASFYGSSFRSKLASMGFHNPNHNILYNRLMEPLTTLADEITVVSDFLQRRFGGIKLPHGADCNLFDPSKYNREKLRAKYGLTDEYIILFSGTPHPHKGLEELIKALELLSLASVRLFVVGYQAEYLERLKEEYGAYIISIGPRPHSDMPEFLSLADLIVLPQRDVPVAQAQVPGKVFEAMAMAKPIIATAVSDLPEILDGCGLIVDPGKPEQLAEAILYVFDHPEEAEKMGWKAREKCKAKYSWEAMEDILLEILRKYE